MLDYIILIAIFIGKTRGTAILWLFIPVPGSRHLGDRSLEIPRPLKKVAGTAQYACLSLVGPPIWHLLVFSRKAYVSNKEPVVSLDKHLSVLCSVVVLLFIYCAIYLLCYFVLSFLPLNVLLAEEWHQGGLNGWTICMAWRFLRKSTSFLEGDGVGVLQLIELTLGWDWDEVRLLPEKADIQTFQEYMPGFGHPSST